METILKKFGPLDFGDYFMLVRDARVMAMITGKAISYSEARRDYEKILMSNAIHPELGHYRIIDARSERFVGLGKLEVTTARAEKAELGYMLMPEYWGKGIAGKTAAQLIIKALQIPTLQSLIAIIDPANIPSRNILIKQGSVSVELGQYDDLPGEILEYHW